MVRVVGFRPVDEKWRKMEEAWDICIKDGVRPSAELYAFFGQNTLTRDGTMVQLNAETFEEDGESGFDIVLSKLPSGIDKIRFYNS